MKRIITCAGLCLALATAVTASFAAGTPAGTSISNRAYADYDDANGNAMTRVYSNTVTTLVSQVAGLEFVPPTATNSAGAGTNSDFLLQFFNRGNGTDSYYFTYSTVAVTDFNPTSVSFYSNKDGNEHHVLDADDPLITPVSGVYQTVVAVTEDDADIFMRVAVPAGATNGQRSVIAVSAYSAFDNTVVAVATMTVEVSAAVLSASIQMAPATLMPGATGVYTITLANAGSAAATGINIADLIPQYLSYVPSSFYIGGSSRTDAADSDEATYYTSPSSVTFNIPSLGAGVTSILNFSVVMATYVPYNTAIPNQATLSFVSGVSTILSNTTGGTFFSALLSSPTFSFTAAGMSADPGDSVVYTMTVTNLGNANDTIDLSYTSAAGFPWVFWVDNNHDGIPGNDGDYLLTDTDADGKVDTGVLGQYGSLSLLAVGTVTAGTADQTVDTLRVTMQSSNDTAVVYTRSVNTTVTAPTLSITKSINPVGSQPPGTELTYTATVTNTGTGAATAVTISDVIPTYTTYKPGSIYTGSTVGGLVARSDADDGDGAKFDSGSHSVIAGSGGNITLGSGATLVLRFTVTID
ncbi:MAG: hypothetical protein A3K53_09505 [Deltaproteobacteria bacterium RIFOXYB2_FULL_66_7]|nr:MAG: hypothetical protein A3K53_09505 [Deltaproteobacteria bacterium RIFOXYB2_FULL_66_7]